MGTFGQTLRQAREDLGASLTDAERETHIHRRYLEALEAEDGARLPAAVYTRGFIRTYSRYLGLNPDAMLDLFGPGAGVAEQSELRPIPAQLNAPRAITIRPAVVLAGLVTAGLLLAYLWSQYTSFVESLNQVEQAATSRLGPPTALPKAEGSGAPSLAVASPSPSPPIVAAAPSPTQVRGLAVEARVTERSWMEVWVDGRSVMAETAPAGFRRSFTAEQQVRMRVGNAAGVQVFVNGVAQGPLGARGDVVVARWERE